MLLSRHLVAIIVIVLVFFFFIFHSFSSTILNEQAAFASTGSESMTRNHVGIRITDSIGFIVLTKYEQMYTVIN